MVGPIKNDELWATLFGSSDFFVGSERSSPIFA